MNNNSKEKLANIVEEMRGIAGGRGDVANFYITDMADRIENSMEALLKIDESLLTDIIIPRFSKAVKADQVDSLFYPR
jgi:hypothetical protein